MRRGHLNVSYTDRPLARTVQITQHRLMFYWFLYCSANVVGEKLKAFLKQRAK